jgi:hypothetical protein
VARRTEQRDSGDTDHGHPSSAGTWGATQARSTSVEASLTAVACATAPRDAFCHEEANSSGVHAATPRVTLPCQGRRRQSPPAALLQTRYRLTTRRGSSQHGLVSWCQATLTLNRQGVISACGTRCWMGSCTATLPTLRS